MSFMPSDQTRIEIAAKRFWDAYFESRVIELERSLSTYAGVLMEYSPSMSHISLPQLIKFIVPVRDLRSYDYAHDVRFNSMPRDLKMALASVISTAPFAEDTLANRVALDAINDSLGKPHAAAGERLAIYQTQTLASIRATTLHELEKRVWLYLDAHHPTRTNWNAFQRTGLTSEMHIGRASMLRALTVQSLDGFQPILRKIASNPCDDIEIVALAIQALARINRRTDADFLYQDVLGKKEMTSRQNATTRALQYLLSRERLLVPTPAIDAKSYWASALSSAPQDGPQWLAHTGHSVFWEKRLFLVSGRDAKHLPSAMLRTLAIDDEVQQVRDAANARWQR